MHTNILLRQYMLACMDTCASISFDMYIHPRKYTDNTYTPNMFTYVHVYSFVHKRAFACVHPGKYICKDLREK